MSATEYRDNVFTQNISYGYDTYENLHRYDERVSGIVESAQVILRDKIMTPTSDNVSKVRFHYRKKLKVYRINGVCVLNLLIKFKKKIKFELLTGIRRAKVVRSLMISELEMLDMEPSERKIWEERIDNYGYIITRVLDTLINLGTEPVEYCKNESNESDIRQSIFRDFILLFVVKNKLFKLIVSPDY